MISSTRYKQFHRGSLPILIAIAIMAVILIATIVTSAAMAGDRTGVGAGLGGSGAGSVGACSSIPEPYKEIFTKAGNKWNVQPSFIAAIFYAGEHGSSWPDANGPWASSPKGAQGPFQFMPATWSSNKQDGNGDGQMEVQNLWDSSFGAAKLFANIGAGGNTDDLDVLRDAASKYNSGRPWSQGQGIPETARYVPLVISAFQDFSCTDGDGIATGTWIWPVKGRITSIFGEIGRSHPQPHTGLDIAVPEGTEIKAADGGTVIKVNLDPTNICGVYVKISHANSTSSVYCHMIENSPKVKEGSPVSQGQIIGLIDSTGHSTGNHLHFGVQVKGKFVDPLSFLP